MQRDNNDELNQKLRRSEMTTKSLDTELNSLKPEIKQLQAESANKFRCVPGLCIEGPHHLINGLHSCHYY